MQWFTGFVINFVVTIIIEYEIDESETIIREILFHAQRRFRFINYEICSIFLSLTEKAKVFLFYNLTPIYTDTDC